LKLQTHSCWGDISSRLAEDLAILFFCLLKELSFIPIDQDTLMALLTIQPCFYRSTMQGHFSLSSICLNPIFSFHLGNIKTSQKICHSVVVILKEDNLPFETHRRPYQYFCHSKELNTYHANQDTLIISHIPHPGFIYWDTTQGFIHHDPLEDLTGRNQFDSFSSLQKFTSATTCTSYDESSSPPQKNHYSNERL